MPHRTTAPAKRPTMRERLLRRTGDVPSALAAAGAVFLLFGPPFGCGGGTAELARPPAAPSPAPAPPATVAGPSPPPAAEPAPAPERKPSRYAVASENPTATKLAMDVLARGGSAADAAVVGVLAVGVTQPVSSGLGGGGFAVVWDAKTRAVTVLDFREVAPLGLKPADYVTRPAPEKKKGVMTGVPGELAGLAEIHARWGKLAFVDVVRGAADVAERGFPVTAHLARALKWNETWVHKTVPYRSFLPSGTLVKEGETTSNLALAATLRRIAAEGKKAFYEGAIAADVVETARAGGSRMTADELRQYQVVERAPLQTRWEGLDVYTMPPPSGGGLMVLETLRMHAKDDLEKLGYGTGAYLHLLAETFRGAVADRVRTVGDPAFVKVDVAKLADPARMKARRARIRMETTTPAERFPLEESGTSHLVAVDGEGNVVSITSTVNNMFGAKLVTKGGFVLNDELEDFSTEAVETRFGLVRGPNAPRGRARPASSMTPTIVVRDGKPVLALGGSGGTRIATGVTQVLLANLVFGLTPKKAVADPRIETPAMGGLFLDASAPPEIAADLTKRGEAVDTTKPSFSAVQAVSIGETDGVRILEAASDPRKGGSAAVE